MAAAAAIHARRARLRLLEHLRRLYIYRRCDSLISFPRRRRRSHRKWAASQRPSSLCCCCCPALSRLLRRRRPTAGHHRRARVQTAATLRRIFVAQAAQQICGSTPTGEALLSTRLEPEAADNVAQLLAGLGFRTALDLRLLGGGPEAEELMGELQADGGRLSIGDRAKVRLLIGNRAHLRAPAAGCCSAARSWQDALAGCSRARTGGHRRARRLGAARKGHLR